ncbi:M20/M25/M40 family metallo-hydrolase [Vagococcus sp. BWB3-3]|uniref:M20/M25/M40 family metallo-hydrolase n=1 Tax=Vagococcus allomyrinae TaxID=2794353 RepID=A0A940PGN8_9ENTE|nr:M20/M25/M40 family metallo-hydrolase [Vagococcus allomyrinae]MBP1044282.1 M20/M25/M40 family metallo-hydrolase [Vagococcus allomyrinae]
MSQERLINTFIELVKIDSESKNEGRFQQFLKERFAQLGLETIEDQSMEKTGLGANNLLCRLPGIVEAEPIFFSCHVDTVTPGVGISPIIKEDAIFSDGTTILGADDKAGIAIMIEVIERLKEQKLPHGVLEFVLSPGEEIGLVGANAFDVSQLESDIGFVLDNGGPVGSITVASPTLVGIETTIKGKTAHAGLEPEKGVSAITIAAKAISKMRLGRINSETTANIGSIHGGTATNIVADEVKVTAEARAISHSECESQVSHMIDQFSESANVLGGEARSVTDVKSVGYRLTDDHRTVRLATQAIMAVDRLVTYDVSGGGSDANVFNAKGKETANLSIGYEKIHTVNEYIPTKELETATNMVLHLVSTVIK